MINILKKHPSLVQFIKFCLIGTSGAVVDLGIYSLLYRLFGVYYMAARAISVFLAIINNFFWNKYWTFNKGNTGKGYQESLKFFIVSIVNYFLNLGIFYSIINFTNLEKLMGQYEDLGAIVIGIGIVMFLNFFGNKYWTFR